MALTGFGSFTPPPFGLPSWMQFPTGATGGSPLLLSNINQQTAGVDPAILSAALRSASLPGAGGGTFAPSAAAPGLSVQPGGFFSSPFTSLATALGLPQFVSGLGTLGSNVAAGGLSGALTGLPALPATLANPAAGLGVIGLGEAPAGAQAATSGLLGSGGDIGGLLPGLGAAAAVGTGIADLLQGNIAGGAGSLGGAALGAGIGSLVPGVGTLLGAALGGGGGGLVGNLFGGKGGGGHTKGSDVLLPGFSGPVHTRTAGGTRTLLKSFQEGQGALAPFTADIEAAKSVPDLLAALNPQRSPFAGQFRVEAQGPGFNFGNLPPSFAPQSHPFTAESLRNPEVLKALSIHAGALGAPAPQPDLVAEVQRRIREVESATAPPLAPADFTSRLQARFPGFPLAARYSPAAQRELTGFLTMAA